DWNEPRAAKIRELFCRAPGCGRCHHDLPGELGPANANEGDPATAWQDAVTPTWQDRISSTGQDRVTATRQGRSTTRRQVNAASRDAERRSQHAAAAIEPGCACGAGGICPADRSAVDQGCAAARVIGQPGGGKSGASTGRAAENEGAIARASGNDQS